MKTPLRLISTDFDGTIVDWERAPFYSTAFFEEVAVLQEAGGHWAINTGRSIPQLERTLEEMQFPVKPDYIITLERAVHRRGADGWEDFGDWNARCEETHRKLNLEAAVSFRRIRDYAARNRGLMLQEKDGDLEGLIAINEGQMDEAVVYLDKLREALPDLSFQRNGVYLRLCHIDYHKGSALAELARLLEVGHGEILAAGDNFNDLPMLDGVAARWVTCPVNAIDTVKEVVRQGGGYVATQKAGDGVAEAIRACPWSN